MSNFRRRLGRMRASALPPLAVARHRPTHEAQVRAALQRERERVAKYGDVRPPISTWHQGQRFVAVGSRLFHNARWKTFHDFLFAYIGAVFEKEWFVRELKEPLERRHPLMQWYAALEQFHEKNFSGNGGAIIKVDSPPAIISALLSFAYDVYTLEHHGLLLPQLVERLQRKEHFQGARYELYVASAFVRAGFSIAFEDEDDLTSSHVEFTVTHRASGAKYSVEAKSRHRPGVLGQAGVPQPLDEIKADLSGLLVKALRKEARHDRIVFIDVNVPPSQGSLLESEWFNKLASQVKRLEENPPSPPLPPAIIFLTNFPYHFVEGDKPLHGSGVFFSGLNIPEFRSGDPSIVAAKFPVILALRDSVLRHTQVPHDFD